MLFTDVHRLRQMPSPTSNLFISVPTYAGILWREVTRGGDDCIAAAHFVPQGDKQNGRITALCVFAHIWARSYSEFLCGTHSCTECLSWICVKPASFVVNLQAFRSNKHQTPRSGQTDWRASPCDLVFDIFGVNILRLFCLFFYSKEHSNGIFDKCLIFSSSLVILRRCTQSNNHTLPRPGTSPSCYMQPVWVCFWK